MSCTAFSVIYQFLVPLVQSYLFEQVYCQRKKLSKLRNMQMGEYENLSKKHCLIHTNYKGCRLTEYYNGKENVIK